MDIGKYHMDKHGLFFLRQQDFDGNNVSVNRSNPRFLDINPQTSSDPYPAEHISSLVDG